MALGRQLPVWSPLTLGAVAAGVLPSAGALPALEKRIREEYSAESVLLTGSGTIALALAYLGSAPPGARPRVALPAWACPDLMTAADAVDAEVLLYDLDPATLGPDLDSLRAALRAGPTAVVVAHWFGLPVDLGPIAGLVADAGSRLIDDAAQGVGASVAGRPVGTGGDYGVLSFGRGKGRTGGSGGALLANTREASTRLPELAARLFPARPAARTIAALLGQWALGRPWLYEIPARIPGLRLGQTIYHAAPPLTQMHPTSAAILAAVWQRSAEEAAIRRANADRWRRAFQAVPTLGTYQVLKNAEAGWLRFPVRIAESMHPVFCHDLMRKCGVSAGYPSPLDELPLTKGRLARKAETFTGARALGRSIFTLPVHRLTREVDFEIVWKCVQRL